MVDFGGHPNVLHYEKSYLVYLQQSTSPDQKQLLYSCYYQKQCLFVSKQALQLVCLFFLAELE